MMNSQSSNKNTEVNDKLDEAYNSRNARAFANLFASDVNVYEFPDRPVQQSREEIFQFYTDLFGEFPENQTEVLHRIVIGNRVIDILLNLNPNASAKEYESNKNNRKECYRRRKSDFDKDRLSGSPIEFRAARRSRNNRGLDSELALAQRDGNQVGFQ